MEIMKRESECELKDLVQKFVPESIGREIEKATKVSSRASVIVYWRGSSLFITGYFPLAKRLHPKSQDPEDSQARFGQAFGIPR